MYDLDAARPRTEQDSPRSVLTFVLTLLCTCAVACNAHHNEATDAGPDTDAGTDPAPDAAAGPDLAMPRSAVCMMMDTKLQQALDQTRMGTTCKETALAVETPACPLQVYVSADDSTTPTDHVYRIASNTKTFTSSVILKQAAQGLLNLDDLATKYLPGVAGLDGMTIRQILSHSAGLYNYTSDDNFINTKATEPTKVWTPGELIAIAAQHGPYFAPGAGWAYSNTDYIVAGLIAEKVGGKKISELIREQLLVPSGLPQIVFDGEEMVQGTLAHGYDNHGDDVTTKFDQSWIWAAGAMVASAADLSHWIKRLGSGQVHDPAFQMQLENGVHTAQDGETYGLGVFMFDASFGQGAGRQIGHIGSVFGYHSHAFYYPDSGITIAAIVTCEDADPNDIDNATLGVLFP